MLPKLTLSILLIGSILTCAAQGVTEIYGKVTDAGTKDGLEFVNIRLHGSLKSTYSDPKGMYSIRTFEKIDSISFSYLGYKTITVPIKKGGSQELNIVMGSGDVMLKEVTVKVGKRRKIPIDTTANYVYYKVLEHKSENRANAANTYKYDNYEKLTISLLNPSKKFINFFLWKPFRFAFKNTDTTDDGNVFIPGLVKEKISRIYYRKHPEKTKEYVSTDIMSGVDNPSVGNIANFWFNTNNVYDNIFTISSQIFEGPFANNAIGTYRYYLTDTALINGRISYKLHFISRVKEDRALKGYAWIDSATWAIQSIIYRPSEKANLNFINDYTVKSDFVFVNNKYWMPSREELNTVGSLLKKGKLAIYITKVTSHTNIEADVDFPDSIMGGPENRFIDDSAHYRNPVSINRPEALTPQESKVYYISDTIKTVPAWKAFQWWGHFLSNAYADAGPITIGRVLNFASRNNVEGWRFRFGFETSTRFQHRGTAANDFFHKFYYTGYVAYGLKDRDFKYLSLVRFALPRKNERWQSLEAYYRYDMRVPGQDENQTLLTFDNIVTLISGQTLNKIMKVREFGINYEKEYVKDFSAITSIIEKTYYDVPGVFDFSRIENGVVKHVPNINVTEFTLDTRYSYNDLYFVGNFYRYFQRTQYPAIMLRYTAGVVQTEGDNFNYHNLQLTVQQNARTILGHTQYIFRAGKIFGKVPYTSAYLTQGNLGILLDKFNYNLLREFEFVSDQYASLWIEQHFDGFFLNKIPGINKLRLREVFTFKGLIGSFNKAKNGDVLTVPTELSAPGPIPYIEMGFGIENIAYLFRVDFLWRVTYRNKQGVPNWGVKLAFIPGF